MTIASVILGENIDPAWGNAVADAINGTAQVGTYTPTLANVVVGTGGTPENTADFAYAGKAGVGGIGIMTVSQSLILGTTGFSVTGSPTFTLPTGFEFDLASGTGTLRLGMCTLVSSTLGFVQWQSATQFALTVMNASATYVTATSITNLIPATWAAGNIMRSNFTARVIRV